MPALQRFHTAGLTKINAANCFTPFTQACPQLSHIRISMASQRNLTCAIAAALNLPDVPASLNQMYLEHTWVSPENGDTSPLIPSLPRDLVSLLIKPAAPPMIAFPGCATVLYHQYMKQLEDLVRICPSGKVRLLPAFKRDLWEVEVYGVEQAKDDWLSSIKGCMGAWNSGSIAS
ncbi:hypothetical protein RhiLY_10998 [Ceratobasidium sp. AG-Ba]|nr:hypothetical protein RhiLY_10998 [Ceratobasidium sp. AG-Ba]